MSPGKYEREIAFVFLFFFFSKNEKALVVE